MTKNPNEVGGDVISITTAQQKNVEDLNLRFSLFESKMLMSLEAISARQIEEAIKSEERHKLAMHDVSKIKEAIYDPETGIFTRLRTVEESKDTASKLIWVVATSIIGISIAGVSSLIWALMRLVANH